MKFLQFIILLSSLLCCGRKIQTKASSPITIDSAVSGTATSTINSSVPKCILTKIDSIKKQPLWNPPAEIHAYELEGKKVYAISADCCDRFTTVVDANCNYVCAPSGGFTGRGDGKCIDFFSKAKHLRLVWKDDRVKK